MVFLNFWATWCPYCLEEMPDIEALYEQYALEGRDDVVILGAAFPGLNGETDTQSVAAYLEENGYLYPTLMDTEGELLSEFYLGGYPTTYMIDAEGNIYGYVTGMIPREFMEQIIEETLGAGLSTE